MLSVALIWVSKSTTKTFLRWIFAKQVAILTVKVVLPTPPFIFTVAITFPITLNIRKNIVLKSFKVRLSEPKT
jgi:hypothetical protein